MAYVTWAEAADKVGGEQRLKTQVMVGHADETSEEHPFFDEQAETASADADAALKLARYEAPLETVTDAKFKGAVMGRLFDLLSETADSRPDWIDKLAESADAYFSQLSMGTIVVIGADREEADEDGGLFSHLDETPQFQLGDQYAGINDVYADLGPRARRWP